MTAPGTKRLELPVGGVQGSSLVLDEAIWGHRLYDEQTPWLTLMEFFNVLHSEEENGRALLEDQNGLTYRPRRRLHLRNILFNNPWLESVKQEFVTSEDRWRHWLSTMSEECGGLQPAARDFSYLQQRFPKFEDFVSLVQLFRTSSIEGDSNKRWSSKFVFPFGPDCLYEDLRIAGDKLSNDRRFFGRTGELVYLMMCRSGKRDELLAGLKPLVFNTDARWNRLARLLQPDNHDEDRASSAGAYLPYQQLPDFATLAEDWLQLLGLRMPGYDALPHMANVTGLHLLLYVLRRACDWAKSGKKGVTLVLEIIAPSKTIVREIAREQYEHNQNLPQEAVEGYLKSIWKSEPVQVALKKPTPFEPTKSALAEALHISSWNRLDLSTSSDPKKLFQELSEFALSRHRQHFANIHRQYGREIGLISRRGTKRLRYAPTDSFLRSIVLANVLGPHMEFNEFLDRLFERYGFVIGDLQANRSLLAGADDRKAFRLNAVRLEERLRALGLVRRLSDDCAYVLNPYAEGGET